MIRPSKTHWCALGFAAGFAGAVACEPIDDECGPISTDLQAAGDDVGDLEVADNDGIAEIEVGAAHGFELVSIHVFVGDDAPPEIDGDPDLDGFVELAGVAGDSHSLSVALHDAGVSCGEVAHVAVRAVLNDGDEDLVAWGDGPYAFADDPDATWSTLRRCCCDAHGDSDSDSDSDCDSDSDSDSDHHHD